MWCVKIYMHTYNRLLLRFVCFVDFEMDHSDIKKLIQQQGVLLQQQETMLNILSNIFQQIQQPKHTTTLFQQQNSVVPTPVFQQPVTMTSTQYGQPVTTTPTVTTFSTAYQQMGTVTTSPVFQQPITMSSTQYRQLITTATTTPVFQNQPVVTISSTAHLNLVTATFSPAFHQPVTVTSTLYVQPVTTTLYGQLVTMTPVFQQLPTITISSTAHQHLVTSAAFQQPISTQHGQLFNTVLQQPPALTSTTAYQQLVTAVTTAMYQQPVTTSTTEHQWLNSTAALPVLQQSMDVTVGANHFIQTPSISEPSSSIVQTTPIVTVRKCILLINLLMIWNFCCQNRWEKIEPFQ